MFLCQIADTEDLYQVNTDYFGVFDTIFSANAFYWERTNTSDATRWEDNRHSKIADGITYASDAQGYSRVQPREYLLEVMVINPKTLIFS